MRPYNLKIDNVIHIQLKKFKGLLTTPHKKLHAQRFEPTTWRIFQRERTAQNTTKLREQQLSHKKRSYIFL